MANVNLLPDFLIIGAAKSGTTALYDLLKQHPQVYLPFDKEPMFFSRDDYFSRGAQWYLDRYFKDSDSFRVRGEATPHYLYWAEKVAPRIAQTFGTRPPKIIAIFRDPLQRAYSWYWNVVRDGLESLPFAEALEAEPRKLREEWDALHSSGSMTHGYFRGGCYATQLQFFLDLFPREQFLFLLQEDLKVEKLDATMRSLFDFLNVDSNVRVQPVTSNISAQPRNRVLHQILHGSSILKEWIKRILPFQWRYRLKQAVSDSNLRPFEYPSLDPQIAAHLRTRYTDEVIRLASMIHRDLSHWMVEP